MSSLKAEIKKAQTLTHEIKQELKRGLELVKKGEKQRESRHKRKKDSRGDVCEGAGREPLGEKATTESITFRVTPSEYELLAEQVETGESVHTLVRRWMLERLEELATQSNEPS